MKIKIVEKLREFLDSDQSKKKDRIKALQKLLKKLENKEDILRERLKNAKTEKQISRNERKLRVCAMQREKGEKALKQLMDG